jgi:cephalosporin hydroxylase
MSDASSFAAEVRRNIEHLKLDEDVQALSRIWLRETLAAKYSYNFNWLGRPIIQFPQDMIALQEIIWTTRPDLIVETGIAHGGSLVFYASLLELLGNDGRVVGVDIEIRPHNRAALERHPLFKRITLMEGSSVDPSIVGQVAQLAESYARVMVVLDSDHTHAHVLEELRRYAMLVTPGNYLVVFDTVIEVLPDTAFPDRAWGKGNNPMTAVREFLRTNDQFEVDTDLGAKLLITAAPDGYLRRTGGS